MLAQLAVGIASFLLVSYVARTISPSLFGRWQFAVAVATYLVVISTTGLGQHGMLVVAGDASSRPGAAPTAIALLRAAAASIVLVLWTVVATLLVSDRTTLTLLLLVPCAALVRAMWPDWLLQGSRRIGLLGAAILSYAIVVLIATIATVHQADDVMVIPIAQLIVAVVLGAGWWAWVLRGLGPMPRWRQLGSGARGTMRAAAPLTLAALSVQLVVNADQLIIGTMRPAEELARYAAAANLSVFVSGLIVAFHAAILPHLSFRTSKGLPVEELISSLSGIALAVTLPGLAAAAFLSRDLVEIAFGQPYLSGTPTLLVILAFQWPLNAIGAFYVNLLLVRGQRPRFAAVFFAAAAFNVALNVALVPVYGATASAIITVATTGAIGALCVRASGSHLWIRWDLAIASTVGTTALVASLIATTDWSLAARCVAGAAIYATVFLGVLAAPGVSSHLRSWRPR